VEHESLLFENVRQDELVVGFPAYLHQAPGPSCLLLTFNKRSWRVPDVDRKVFIEGKVLDLGPFSAQKGGGKKRPSHLQALQRKKTT
jgi:hypothetical protein